MAKTKLSASPDTEKTRQKIIFFPSDNAEQLLQKLECFAQGILANYNDETDTGSEEVAYANAMLMRVKQTRRFMADAMRSRQEENMSLNVNAAVREAINAMLEFVSLHNSGIEPSYLRGEKTIKNASEGGFARAREYKQRNSKRQQEILDYARNFAGNPRSLASCAAKKFKLTPKTIREILKKTGFQSPA